MDRHDTEIISPARREQRRVIKDLVLALPERGKLKIGAKGQTVPSKKGNEFQLPVKLDHFRITTLRRQEDGNLERDESMHRAVEQGGFGDKPTEIPVRLLYDDPTLNFPTRYAAFLGRTLWCSGDGERALRLTKDGKDRFELDCPCGLAAPSYQPGPGDPPRCKMNGSLSVLIDGASGIGGVWKFRTTSYNSITGLMGAMVFIKQITGGPLANIPLKLRVQPKQATAPTDGSSVLIYIVSLEFDGNASDLMKMGHQIALERATTHVSIAEIETEARRMLALAAPANAPLAGDDPEDIVAEFYPEQMTQDDDRPPARRPRPRPQDYIDQEDRAASEEPSFEVADLVGDVTAHPSAEAAKTALLELIQQAGSLKELQGLGESNTATSVIREIGEALGEAAAAEVRQAYTSAKAAFQARNQSSEAAGDTGQTEHPEERQSTQTERKTAEPVPQDTADEAASRDGPKSLAVAIRKPLGGRTDWSGTKDDMVAIISGLTDPADVATNGAFIQANRLVLDNMRIAAHELWMEVKYYLTARADELAGGES